MKNHLENMFGLFFTPTAKKSYVALVDQAILSATNFITAILLARVVEPAEYGAYVLALSVLLLANGLQSALVGGPVTILGAPKEEDDFKQYVTALGLAQSIISASLVALAFAVVGIISFTSASTGLKSALLGMAVALFFVQIQEFCRRVLFARLLCARVLINDSIFCVLQLGGLFLLYQLDASSAASAHRWLSGRNVFFCLAGSACIGSALGLFQVRRFLGSDISSARSYYRESWNYAKWGLASFFGSILIVQASSWVIGAMAGVAAVGMIEAARLLVAPLHIVQFGGPNITTPRAAKAYGQGGAEALLSFTRRLAPLWIAAFISYGIVVAAAPGFWLRLFFRERYSSAGVVVTLWVGVYVIEGLRHLPGMVLSSMRRPDVLLYVILPEGILTVVLTAVCTRFFGAEWSVAGRIVAESIGFIVIGLYAFKILSQVLHRSELSQ